MDDPVTHRLGFLSSLEPFLPQCSPEDQAQFVDLWQAHRDSIPEDAIAYFVPGNMGTALERMHLLSQIARKMATFFSEPMVFAFDRVRNIYFIGSAQSVHYNPQDVLNRFPGGGLEAADQLFINLDGLLDHNRNIRGVVDEQPEGNDNNRVLPLPVEAHAVDINNIPAQLDGGQVDNAIQDVEPAAEDGEFADPPAQANDKKIPKPRNMWIFYRAEKHKEIAAEYPDMHTSQISKLASDMWKNAGPEVKAKYKALAEEEKQMYAKLYPNYKCVPRKSADIKKRKSAKAQPNMDDGHQAGGQAQRRIAEEAQQQEVARIAEVARLDGIRRGLEDFHDQIRAAQEQRRIAEEAQQQEVARIAEVARLDEIRRGLEDFHDQIRAAQEQRRVGEEAQQAQQAQQLEFEYELAPDANFGAFDMNPFGLLQDPNQQVVNFEQGQEQQVAVFNPIVAIGAREEHNQLDIFQQFVDFNQGTPVEAQDVVLRFNEEDQVRDNGVNGVAADKLNTAIERHARLLKQLQDEFRNEIEGLGVEFPVAYAQLENAVANL